ncbi:hypothetical protein KAU11_06330, partial [Candidatus Babeliales bacterium]|nr:hypothetical protein [Candidatus Babeliales bacterium]
RRGVPAMSMGRRQKKKEVELHNAEYERRMNDVHKEKGELFYVILAILFFLGVAFSWEHFIDGGVLG